MLASGSSGNAALLSTRKTRVLVDAGLSYRELKRRLVLAEEGTGNLDAILVTHEHSDHVGGLAILARRVEAPVYATRYTAQALDWGDCRPRVQTFQAGASFTVGDIDVDSFTIPHDAADPVGFCFYAEGVKIGLATDLGYITQSIKFHLRGTNLLLLESNHDLEMLKVGPYPWPVKQRVMSRVGHLSNSVTCDFLLRDFAPAAPNVILGHLSEQNNHPELVRIGALEALERRGISARLAVALQDSPAETFTL